MNEGFDPDHDEHQHLLTEQLLLVGKNVKSSAGGSNFKLVAEDIKLASEYVVVTTNAAVGTDQDGNTFWDKIREHFIQLAGGLATRSRVSLKN